MRLPKLGLIFAGLAWGTVHGALPDYAVLADGIGRPDPSRVLRIAPEVDGATCIPALESEATASWLM